MGCVSDVLVYKQAKDLALKVVKKYDLLHGEYDDLLTINENSFKLNEILYGMKTLLFP
jgi:hypothetical protein